MLDEFGTKHGAACKSVPAMGRMNDFYIVNGRKVFYEMGSGCRIHTLTQDRQFAAIFSGPVYPFFKRWNFCKDLFCEGNGGATGGVFFLCMMNFPHFN